MQAACQAALYADPSLQSLCQVSMLSCASRHALVSWQVGVRLCCPLPVQHMKDIPRSNISLLLVPCAPCRTCPSMHLPAPGPGDALVDAAQGHALYNAQRAAGGRRTKQRPAPAHVPRPALLSCCRRGCWNFLLHAVDVPPWQVWDTRPQRRACLPWNAAICLTPCVRDQRLCPSLPLRPSLSLQCFRSRGALTCLPGKLCGDLPDQLWQAPTRGARENSGWGWAVATSLLCVHTTSRHR